MLQKYEIDRNGSGSKLKIREYAMIGRIPRNTPLSTLKKGPFTLLCEETYDGERIARSISSGVDALVVSLRTHNMYPIKSTALKIAESVVELYQSADNRLVELFFDDIDLIPVAPVS